MIYGFDFSDENDSVEFMNICEVVMYLLNKVTIFLLYFKSES